MLVLSRQKDQTIMIGDDIEITIVDVKGDKVRVGIRAPSDVPVHRKEVYLAIKAENLEASNTGTVDLASLAKLLPGPVAPLGGDPPSDLRSYASREHVPRTRDKPGERPGGSGGGGGRLGS